MALVSAMNPLAAQPFSHYNRHAQPALAPHLAAPGKDSRWLTLELCREFQRGKCSRSDAECKYAHPPPHVEVQNGRVVCCYDSIKGKCQRKEPPCKYLHPPQHLKEQLLLNGRNNLLMKNLQLQMAGLTLQSSIVPMPLATYSYDSCRAGYSPPSADGYNTVMHGAVVTSPYLLSNSVPYVTPTSMSGSTMAMQPVDATLTSCNSSTIPMSSTVSATRTESAPPTINASSINMSAGEQPWTNGSLVSTANPYSPIYYQNMSGMMPVMKHPDVKNGLHVYTSAPYPQSMHLSQMQPAYVPVTGIIQQQQTQQQPAHY